MGQTHLQKGVGYAKILNTVVSPGDFFILKDIPGVDCKVVGRLVLTSFNDKDIHPSRDRDRAISQRDDHADGIYDGESLDHSLHHGPFFLMQLYLCVNETIKNEFSLPVIQSHLFPQCNGMEEVVGTDLVMWCGGKAIKSIAFVNHVDEIQNGCVLFGGKGVFNSFCISTSMKVEGDGDGDYSFNITACASSTHYAFSHLNPSTAPHYSYNYRVYSQMGSLRYAVNALMHTQRMYQRSRHSCQAPLMIETWEYLCKSLKDVGGNEDLMKRREKVKTKRLFLNDLQQEKRRIMGEEMMIMVEDRDELKTLRKVMGHSFGVGVRSKVKLGDGVKVLGNGDFVNAVWPPDDNEMNKVRSVRRKVSQLKGKYRNQLTDDELSLFTKKTDSIMLRYDPLFCICHISIVFTRVQIGKDSDMNDILKSIDHNILFETIPNPFQLANPPLQLELGQMFDYQNSTYMFSVQEGDLVTGYHIETNAEITVPISDVNNIN